MQCFIYKSKRKQDTYLYVTRENDFSAVPQSLQALLGQLEKVMELTLDQSINLANADLNTVTDQLNDQGFYLQMPPGKDKIDAFNASLI